MDKKNQIRKPPIKKPGAGKGKPVKSGVADYFPALGIGAAIVLLAFIMPRFLKVEPSTQEQISQDAAKSFRNDCVSLVLRSGDVLPSCASLEAIRSSYGIDAMVMLMQEQARMAGTAQKIASGDITNESELKQCIRKNECVKVPGLNFDIEAGTPAGKAAQAEFWHLVNDGSITAGTCDMMELCRAMMKIGIYQQPSQLSP